MKRLLILLVFAATMSCQVNYGGNATETVSNLSYFQDPNTNLCFGRTTSATYNGLQVVSITCVPCDSIPKNLLVH